MSEDLRKVSLPVSGMTCAACARRVEKALSGTAGVRAANVNLAAEKATVEYDPALVGSADLAGAVEGAGYGVVLEEERVEDAHAREYKRLRSRFLVAAVLTVFILIGSLPPMLGLMLPIPMGWLNLGLLLLATPVQFWAGWRFYRGAWSAWRHASADMNTLMAVGMTRPICTAWSPHWRRSSLRPGGRTCTSTPQP